MRPDRRHRLRGHPRHRRPGRRRHPDLHRQAHRLHRRRWHPPAAGHPGGARRRHRQPAAAQRRALPGRRHARVRDERYDDFIDAYVDRGDQLFPHALLHWEDFGAGNARRILDRYADSCCTFNDDMQGTAAVVLAGASWPPSASAGARLRDQRVVILGAGTAGMGIADMVRDAMVEEGLSAEEATRRFWALGRKGLLTDRHGGDCATSRCPTRGPPATWPAGPARTGPSGWPRSSPTSGRPSSSAPRPSRARSPSRSSATMAAHVERPIILPLSNPTSRCEALPEDLLALDRRPRPGGHRQPVPAGRPRRPDARHRPGQQRAGLPRPGAGRRRVPGPARSATP